MRMDKALMLVVGGLLTVFALIPDQQSQSASTGSTIDSTENLSPSAVVSATAQAPQAEMPVYADSGYSAVPEPRSVQPKKGSGLGNDYNARREVQRARVNAEEIARQTPIH